MLTLVQDEIRKFVYIFFQFDRERFKNILLEFGKITYLNTNLS
jgi:hypothetical protein